MSVNSVKVYSIDEEKLKFRVIVSFAADLILIDQGRYEFQLPPLTSFGNSGHYNSCVINCDAFQVNSQVGTNDACWMNNLALHRLGAVELRLDVPSSQTLNSLHVNPFFGNQGGDNRMGGYRQLVPIEMKLIGNGAGGVGAAYDAPTAAAKPGAFGWFGHGVGDEILCGNPFGNKVIISNNMSYGDTPIWIGSAAAGAGSPDLGMYHYQVTITMVTNRP